MNKGLASFFLEKYPKLAMEKTPLEKTLGKNGKIVGNGIEKGKMGESSELLNN